MSHGFEYDLIVVGGGSGGLACSKEAAKFGAKVAVLDFVKPTPVGTTWGLGGTCVNVGCIPKKLMHQAALLGEGLEDAKEYGWEIEGQQHNWEKMLQGVQDHIGSINWGYRVELRSKQVDYFNALGSFVDPHTIECKDRKGVVTRHTADKFVIAVGGRPKYLGVPGDKELCITSDDLFSLQNAPGKTLVVGASYVALECAGFLTALKYDVTVMARSIFLRGFDQECAGKIVDYMGTKGTKFVQGSIPTKFERVGESQVRAFWTDPSAPGGETSDVFDTVLLAVGRTADTHTLGLDKIGLMINPSSKKIVSKEEYPGLTEGTSVQNVFAIGDVLDGRPELTPVAILAGKLLARRLFNFSWDRMDYVNVPTTVFTPLEYGSVGLSEEDAIAQYGADDVEVYVSDFTPLEYTVAHRDENSSFAKLVCVRSQEEKVVGLHYLGRSAGEVLQGFGLAVKVGVKKSDFDSLVGIHPTSAEEFTVLSVTKRSGESAKKKGC